LSPEAPRAQEGDKKGSSSLPAIPSGLRVFRVEMLIPGVAGASTLRLTRAAGKSRLSAGRLSGGQPVLPSSKAWNLKSIASWGRRFGARAARCLCEYEATLQIAGSSTVPRGGRKSISVFRRLRSGECPTTPDYRAQQRPGGDQQP